MEAAAGLGSLLGTVAIVRLRQGIPQGPVMLVSAALFGVLIALFTAATTLPIAMLFLFLGGVASSLYLNLGMTALQLQVPNALRGRVMGIWSMTYFLAAAGGLPAAMVATWIGTPAAVALGALSVTAFAILLLVFVPSLRAPGSMDAPLATAARGSS